MTTTVTITGTSAPPLSPGRAGAGVLVTHGDVALQFDAGRATALRLVEAGSHPAQLDAVFLTHHHSDHLLGVVDLVFSAWLHRPTSVDLTFVAPQGPLERFLDRMLDAYDDDIEVRRAHTGRDRPSPDIRPFAAGEPTVVWEGPDVQVSARTVQHQPVDPAVAYKVETPDGSIVISGDTIVCDEIEQFARGCDVLVHEVFDVDGFVERTGDPSARRIGDYHADAVGLGAMVERAAPGRLLLTHLVPPPRDQADKDRFAAAVRAGGYTGPLLVCDDLDSVTVGD